MVWIALAGILVGSIVLRSLEVFLSRADYDQIRAENRRALQRLMNERYTMDRTLSCSVYEVRLTQQKMVDAGIIEQHELSVCEDKDCNNCYATGLHNRRYPKYLEKRTMLTAEQPSTRQRHRDKYAVNMPRNVPDSACLAKIGPATYSFGQYTIVEALWLWVQDGKKFGAKSIHSIENPAAWLVENYPGDLRLV